MRATPYYPERQEKLWGETLFFSFAIPCVLRSHMSSAVACHPIRNRSGSGRLMNRIRETRSRTDSLEASVMVRGGQSFFVSRWIEDVFLAVFLFSPYFNFRVKLAGVWFWKLVTNCYQLSDLRALNRIRTRGLVGKMWMSFKKDFLLDQLTTQVNYWRLLLIWKRSSPQREWISLKRCRSLALAILPIEFDVSIKVFRSKGSLVKKIDILFL